MRDRIWMASEELPEKMPMFSAKGMFKWSVGFLCTALALILIFIVLTPRDRLFTTIILFFNLFFFCNTILKSVIFVTSCFLPKTLATRKIADEDLPIYTILVPLFKEKKSTIQQVTKALQNLHYPTEKKDIKLILEHTDKDTLANIPENLGVAFEVIVVPDSQPKTKPKACNYALQTAKGEYVCIFDAEDIPDQNQLISALGTLQHNNVGQAQLTYYNWDRNVLTKMFYFEYECLFKFFLPALQYFHLPIPLGGTSNHFKRHELNQLGGWDAYNVTEDADLGIRYYRHRKNVGIIYSETHEEAPFTMGNWLNQRSRWIKGYMQTLLVHLRQPWRTYKELGFIKFFGFLFFIGAPTMTFVFMPFALLVSAFAFFATMPLSNGLWYFTGANLFGGIILHIGIALTITLKTQRTTLLAYSLLYPFYWLLHPIAALIAVFELIFAPYYWRKTIHGE